MSELRTGIFFMACLVALGCDGDRPGNDAGVDSGTPTLMDSGPPRDTGPLPDTGPQPDTGTTPGSCGPTGGACDISVPTSCGAGMACVLTRESAGGPIVTGCTTSGVLGQGQACDPAAGMHCQEGFQCSTESMTCQKYCCSNVDCDPGVTCQLLADTNNAGLCREADSCALPDTDPAECGDGEGCLPLGSEGDTQCSAVMNKAPGETCMFSNDCQPGYGCVGDPGTCRRFCTLGADPSECADGDSCGRLTIGGATEPIPTYGVCVTPSG